MQNHIGTYLYAYKFIHGTMNIANLMSIMSKQTF